MGLSSDDVKLDTETEGIAWLSAMIGELLSIAGQFVERPSDAQREAFFAEMVVVTTSELVHGIQSEVGEQRLANATRLARHLFEHQVDLHYTLQNFGPRIRQRIAEEARSAVEHSDGPFPSGPVADQLKASLADARRREDQARRDARAVRDGSSQSKSDPDDRGFLPSLEQRAKAVGLEHRYVDYRSMSAISHPGFRSAIRQLRPTPEAPPNGEHETEFKDLPLHLMQLVLCEGVAVFGDILAAALLLRDGRTTTFERVDLIVQGAHARCNRRCSDATD